MKQLLVVWKNGTHLLWHHKNKLLILCQRDINKKISMKGVKPNMAKSKKLCNVLEECKPYTKNIMDDIHNELQRREIPLSTNSKITEIIVDGKYMDDVQTIIHDDLQIPKNILTFLVHIAAINNKIYIRLKFY